MSSTPTVGDVFQLVLDPGGPRARFAPFAGPPAAAQWRGAIWVDGTNGNDATGNGSILAPYKTISKAVSVLVAGQMVVLAAGTYNENVVWRDLDSTGLMGFSGAAATVIANVGASDTFTWTPAASAADTIKRFRLQGVTLQNTTAGQRALVLDGSNIGFPNTMGEESIDLLDVLIVKTGAGQGAFLNCLGYVNLTQSDSSLGFPLSAFNETWQGATKAQNVSSFIARGVAFSSLDYNYNPADGPTPRTGRVFAALLDGASVVPTGVLTLRGAPIFVLDRTAVVYGSIDATLLASFFGGPGQNYNALVVLSGTVGSPLIPGSGGVRLNLPDVAAGGTAQPFADLSSGVFAGRLQLKRLGGTRSTINAAQANFTLGAPDSVDAGALIDLDLRSAKYSQTALGVTATGTIDRDMVQMLNVPDAGGAQAIAIVPPLPATATYGVSCTANTAGLAVGVTAKASNGFTATTLGVGGGTIDYTVLRHP